MSVALSQSAVGTKVAVRQARQGRGRQGRGRQDRQGEEAGQGRQVRQGGSDVQPVTPEDTPLFQNAETLYQAFATYLHTFNTSQ